MPRRKINPNCCLCGLPYERIGNNPAPLAEKGRCCDACNEVVIEARMFPADMMGAIDRVAGAMARKCDTAVAVICALRGPPMLAQKKQALLGLAGALAQASPSQTGKADN